MEDRLQDGRDVADLILRSRGAASRRMGHGGASWFETREDALLTMRETTLYHEGRLRCAEKLRRRGRHHLRQKLLALRLRAIALHGRREALEDAVLERGDNGVVNIALAADRRRVGQLVGGGADRFQYLLSAAPGPCPPRKPPPRFPPPARIPQGTQTPPPTLNPPQLPH